MLEATAIRLRICLFVAAALGAVGISGGIGAKPALACDTGYWNIGCQFYSPREGHSAYQFGPDVQEWVNSTFDTYSTVLVMSTTAGGSWTESSTITYNQNYIFFQASDKVGCYNHHTGTMYVNCRHYEG